MPDEFGQLVRANEAQHAGFAQLLCVEWTRFRTNRGWVIGMIAAVMLTVSLGLLFAAGCQASFEGPNGLVRPSVPLGPDGEAVVDQFYFMHQPLTGNGSVSARVTSLTGIITYPPPNHDQIVPGVVPWAKAGVILKASTAPGSSYAAVMFTGSHRVRMQDNFLHDTAGRPVGVPAPLPRWLRLVRVGDTLTGYESSDGKQWTETGTAYLAGLPATVEAGLFVTSPGDVTVSEGASRFTQATATSTMSVCRAPPPVRGAPTRSGPPAHGPIGSVSTVRRGSSSPAGRSP
jgi:hypothetical protein